MQPDGEVLVETNISALSVAKNAVSFVNSYSAHYPTEILPALNLHMFNFMMSHPNASQQDLEEEINNKKIQRHIRTESDQLVDPNLPSIGLEVEVSDSFFNRNPNDMLNPLELMGLEISDGGYNSTEIEFPPSASASTQSLMLYEMRAMGVIPTDSTFASLHINIGTDRESWFKNMIENKAVVEALSDLLTYANVPAGRVENREYPDAITIDKDFDERVSRIRQVKQPVQHIVRLEFRTPRVFGPRTYRLLSEVQQICTLFQSDKSRIKRQFVEDVNDSILSKYRLPPGAPKDDPKLAAKALREAWEIKKQHINRAKNEGVNSSTPHNIIDVSRYLMTRYAQKISDLLETS